MTSGKIYAPGSHLAGDQFEWVHPNKDLRILGTIFMDNGSRTAIVHVHFEGPISERLGNITGEMAAETLRSCWTRYYAEHQMRSTPIQKVALPATTSRNDCQP